MIVWENKIETVRSDPDGLHARSETQLCYYEYCFGGKYSVYNECLFSDLLVVAHRGNEDTSHWQERQQL